MAIDYRPLIAIVAILVGLALTYILIRKDIIKLNPSKDNTNPDAFEVAEEKDFLFTNKKTGRSAYITGGVRGHTDQVDTESGSLTLRDTQGPATVNMRNFKITLHFDTLSKGVIHCDYYPDGIPGKEVENELRHDLKEERKKNMKLETEAKEYHVGIKEVRKKYREQVGGERGSESEQGYHQDYSPETDKKGSGTGWDKK